MNLKKILKAKKRVKDYKKKRNILRQQIRERNNSIDEQIQKGAKNIKLKPLIQFPKSKKFINKKKVTKLKK